MNTWGGLAFLMWGFETIVHSLLEICLGDCITGENSLKIGHQEKIDIDFLCGSNYACLSHSATIQYARLCSLSEKIYSHVIPLRICKLEYKFLLIIPLKIFIWYSVIKNKVICILHITCSFSVTYKSQIHVLFNQNTAGKFHCIK